jgi:hypothetical protein
MGVFYITRISRSHAAKKALWLCQFCHALTIFDDTTPSSSLVTPIILSDLVAPSALLKIPFSMLVQNTSAHINTSSVIELPKGYIPSAVNSVYVFTKAITSRRALVSSSFTSHNLMSVLIFLTVVLSFRFLYLIPLITNLGKVFAYPSPFKLFLNMFYILTFWAACGVSRLELL